MSGARRSDQPQGRPADDARSVRLQEHRERRRAELVDAAVRAIREQGPAVGMEDIAAAAGVSKPVLYRHFADRAELAAAVDEAVVLHLRHVVSAALRTPRSPRGQVLAAVDAYLAMVEAEPGLYRFVHHRAAGEGGRHAVLDYSGRIAEAVARFLEPRLGPDRDAATAAVWGAAAVGMVHAAGDRWLEQGGGDRERLAADLVDLLWGGLGEALGELGEDDEDD